jgi:hypothetical protein
MNRDLLGGEKQRTLIRIFCGGSTPFHGTTFPLLSGIWSRVRTDLFWIVIVAFTIRLLVIFLFHTYRFGPGQPYNFGYEMGRIGRSIAQGNGFGNIYEGLTGPTAYEPPLYPYLVSCRRRL